MLLTLRTPRSSLLPGEGPIPVRTLELPRGRAHLFHLGPDEVAVLVEPDLAGLPFPKRAAFPAAGFMAHAVGELLPAAFRRLGDEPRPVEVCLPVLASTEGEAAFVRVFQPLGYALEPTLLPLDPRQPEVPGSWLYSLVLRGRQRPREVASHLRVLLPLFDASGVQPHDAEAAWEEGRPWLESHPKREMLERRIMLGGFRPDLHMRRHEAVVTALKESGARRVLDLGCGTGALLGRLLEEPQFTEVVGVEVDRDALGRAEAALPPGGRARVLHGSLAYRDARLAGFDAAAVVEVIEHLDPPQLAAFEDAVWAGARPGSVVLTTPNADYNTLFEYHRGGRLRHPDHRFEWTRAEFQAWAAGVAARHSYVVRFAAVGREVPGVGALTQMAVFERRPVPPAAAAAGGLSLEEITVGGPIPTRRGSVHMSSDEAAAALEEMSRFAVDPRWLVYLPPTTPAAETPPGAEALEHPSAALAYYRGVGATGVALQPLHRGTRVVVVVCRDVGAARRGFGAASGETGAVYTARGRPFFAVRAAEEAFLGQVRAALDAESAWEELGSEWVALEGVIGPGFPAMREVSRGPGPAPAYYWAAGAAERAALEAEEAALVRAAAAGGNVTALLSRTRERVAAALAYDAACRRCCVTAHALDELGIAPVRLLASEGAVHAPHDPCWHRERLAEGMEQVVIDLADPEADRKAEAWWDDALACGGTGVVVRPLEPPGRGGGMAAPAVKCRGADAVLLRHGPGHARAAERGRGLGEEGDRAAREWALSLEALERFTRGEPLARVHACVFAALGVKLGARP